MSVEAIKWALNDAPDVPPQLVSVLVGLANHAGSDGRGAFASQATLARYARKSDRAVRNDLKELLRLGLIRVSENQGAAAHIRADLRPVVYDLALERRAGTVIPGGSQVPIAPGTVVPPGSTVPGVKGDESGQGRSTPGSTVPGGSRVPGGSAASNARKHTSDEPTTNQLPKDSSSPPAAPAGDATPKPKSKPKKPEPYREDVDKICHLLADLMVANECKPPTISDDWRAEARRMFDIDRRPFDKAMALLAWSQQDTFWKRNVLSLPTFRAKYDQLRLAANEDWAKKRAESQAADESRPKRPEWCGKCDPQTRMVENADRIPGRCPRCHPSTQKANA